MELGLGSSKKRKPGGPHENKASDDTTKPEID